jgi:hypothetical protein
MQRSSERMTHQTEKAGLATLRVMPFVLVILLVVGYLIAIPVGLIGGAQRLGTPEIILAAALLVALAFAAQTDYTITDLTLGSGGKRS